MKAILKKKTLNDFFSGCDDLFIVDAPEDGIAFSDKIEEVKSNQFENILDTVAGVTSTKVSNM